MMVTGPEKEHAAKSGKRKSGSDASLKALMPKHRHRFVTFRRVLKYGLSSFSRNAWLSVASTAVMLVTLFIIGISFVARDIVANTVNEIRDSIEMSIYVNPDTSRRDIAQIKSDLEGLSSVKSVTYVSPEEAKEQYARDNINEPNTIDILNKAKNNFQGTFNIKVVDIDDTSQLEDFVETNETIRANISERYKPSFATDRKAAIDNISRTVNFAEKAGLLVTIIFVVIATLMIFNTIRMSINNRREEIYMMRLIGADKGFIRGPFLVEAVLNGIIAAILATVLVYGLLYVSKDSLQNYGIVALPTMDMMRAMTVPFSLAMLGIGAAIGMVSAILAARKYLKSKD
jgi:cell division transport system permease protein